jgi:hypothetical protein
MLASMTDEACENRRLLKLILVLANEPFVYLWHFYQLI